MKPLPYFVVTFLFSLLQYGSIAQLRKAKAGAEPLWASVTRYNYSNNSLEQEAEGGYFDIAFEKQVSLSQQSVYYRKVVKVLTESGVQNSSEISVTFASFLSNPDFSQRQDLKRK